jgi:nitrogen fixation protein NifQ
MTVPDPIPVDRIAEYEAIRALLMTYASPDDASAANAADWIARSALGDQHLYKDMGFSDRSEVRALITAHFPQFAAENTKDMRWKKFIYRRLCGWEGFQA